MGPARTVQAPLTRTGEYLASLIGPEYLSIGSTYHHGASTGWMPYLRDAGVGEAATCGSLDAELDRADRAMFIVDLRTAHGGPVTQWLSELRPQPNADMSSYVRLSPSRAWDAVLHIRRITPTRRVR